jgi:hypothetical protein
MGQQAFYITFKFIFGQAEYNIKKAPCQNGKGLLLLKSLTNLFYNNIRGHGKDSFEKKA